MSVVGEEWGTRMGCERVVVRVVAQRFRKIWALGMRADEGRGINRGHAWDLGWCGQAANALPAAAPTAMPPTALHCPFVRYHLICSCRPEVLNVHCTAPPALHRPH